MTFQAPLAAGDAASYLKIMAEGSSATRHVDLQRWLQGNMQALLPHDILLSGWGNFEEGSVQHDVVSALPGVRSYAAGTDCLPFLLSKFHSRWVAAGRSPSSLDFREFAHLLGSTSLPGTFSSAMRSMRSVLIHGMRDQRGRHECLYVLLSARELPLETPTEAISVLLPCIDAALRQITQLPQQYRPAQSQLRATNEDASGLSERETQIMAWVAMGKTNSEIGTILNISGYTVKNHMQRIFQKLNVFNRTQAVSKVTRAAIDG
jgi:transcriptional regulator EpsA